MMHRHPCTHSPLPAARPQARYIVERSDADLWLSVLGDDNKFRRQLVDQVGRGKRALGVLGGLAGARASAACSPPAFQPAPALRWPTRTRMRWLPPFPPVRRWCPPRCPSARTPSP